MTPTLGEFIGILLALIIASILIIPLLRDDTSPPPPHLARIGLPPSQTNLPSKQATPPPPGAPRRLESLFIYPIKSCRGIELARSRVLPTGLEFDRLYTFAQRRIQTVEEDSSVPWEFLTQRQKPLLATLKVELFRPHDPAEQQGGGGILVVTFPWRDAGLAGLAQWLTAKLTLGVQAQPEKRFTLPVDFPADNVIASKGYHLAPVKVWKETVLALNMAGEIPKELRQYLGMANHHLALFRMDPSRQRQVFRCAPRKDTAGYQPVVDFHDAYPLHLISLSSVEDLESRIEKDDSMSSLDVRRFRSNIIVSTPEPYDEETWRSISFGTGNDQNLFDVSCRTVRCKMPNVNPLTGVRHKSEPDRSLRKYRDVDQGAPKYGCLGMQLCPMFRDAHDVKNRQSVLEVGMELSVLQRGSHLYIPQ